MGRGRFGEKSVTRSSIKTRASSRPAPPPKLIAPQPRPQIKPVSFNKPRPQPRPQSTVKSQPQQRTKKPTSVFQPKSQPVRTSTRSSARPRPSQPFVERPRQTIQAVQRQAPEKLQLVAEKSQQTKPLPNRSSSSSSFRKGGVLKETIVTERTNLFGNREGFTRQINYKKDDTGFKKLSGNTNLTTPNPKAKFQSQEKRDFAEITRLNAGKKPTQKQLNQLARIRDGTLRRNLKNNLTGIEPLSIKEKQQPIGFGGFNFGQEVSSFVQHFPQSNVGKGLGRVKAGLEQAGEGVFDVVKEVSPPFIIGNTIQDNVKIVPNENSIFGLGIQINNPFEVQRKPITTKIPKTRVRKPVARKTARIPKVLKKRELKSRR